jgi:hypothetical protein
VIDLGHYIHGLECRNGIWTASDIQEISYPEHGNSLFYDIEDNSFWFLNRNRLISQLVRKYSIEGPIFDVGGGNGFVSSALCALGKDTVLVEPGLEGCLNGLRRGLRYIINNTFNSINYLPDSIPNIGLFDVMEHIEDPVDFLKLIYANMNTGGRLFITVPAYQCLWSDEDKDAGHYRRYTEKELFNLLSGNGFKILLSSYFFSSLVFPIFLFRTIPSKMGFYKITAGQTSKQHTPSIGTRILNFITKLELNRIERGKSILFGSSIVIVAEKK